MKVQTKHSFHPLAYQCSYLVHVHVLYHYFRKLFRLARHTLIHQAIMENYDVTLW